MTPFIAALWGSLPQLSTGPIAIMSLLVLTTLSPLAAVGSDRYITKPFTMDELTSGVRRHLAGGDGSAGAVSDDARSG